MLRLLLQLYLITVLVTIACAGSKVQKIVAERNKDVLLNVPQNETQDLTLLTLTHNNTYYIVYDPKAYSRVNSTNKINFYSYSKTLYLKNLSSDDSGNWTIQATYQKYDSSTGDYKPGNLVLTAAYYVEVFQKVETFKAAPSANINVYPDRIISVQFPKAIEDMVDCRILDNQKIEHNLLSSVDRLENMEIIGQCGMKMRTDKSQSGTWYLLAYTKNETVYRAEFNINVVDPEKYAPKHENIYFALGSNARISSGTGYLYCTLEDPHGISHQSQRNKCIREINTVKKYHEGVWKMTYAVPGSENLITDTITVHVYDTRGINDTVTVAQNGSILLQCSDFVNSLDYCTFIRPDNLVLNVLPGIGNDEYTFFGSPEDIKNINVVKSTCGITILNPKSYDYGAWKCKLRSDEYNSHVKGSILQVLPNNSSHPHYITSAEDIAVKVDESFTVKCNANAKLTYCWLKSPNGTTYSISNNGKFPTTLKYTGLGYSLGECGATIPKSTKKDMGVWTCHMGIENDSELKVPFNVTITDYRLIARKSKIIESKYKAVELACVTLPGNTDSIEFCRWITPKNVGMFKDDSVKYSFKTGSTQCSLKIKKLDEEDLGTWSCYVRLSGIAEEQSAKIILEEPSFTIAIGSYISIGVSIGLLIMSAITVFICIVHRRRKKAADKKNLIDRLNQEQVYPDPF